MTPARAKQILREVWGQARILSAKEAAEVEAVEKPHENCIDTLCRVAGLPPWNPKTHPPFSDKAREYFSAIV